MDASDESLAAVFNALDSENKGYITVDQFVSTFSEFYQSSDQRGRKISTAPCGVEQLLLILDPENDGIIHYQDFKRAFQEDLGLEESGDHGHEPYAPSGPDFMTSNSRCLSDGMENKTDDSGVHVHDPMAFDFDNDSSLSTDGFNGTHLLRDEGRRSWPKHRGGPHLHSTESPGSASRSDILGDVESNFELLHDRMKRMEAQVENISSTRSNGDESRINRLREENARFSAQITILEERLKEAEARELRNVEAERQHLQSVITRNERDHSLEVESLRSRIKVLESECNTLRLESLKIQADKQASVATQRKKSEDLAEAHERIESLKEEMKEMEETYNQQMEVLRRDRDHAVHVLEEMNNSLGDRRRSRTSPGSPVANTVASGSDLLIRYQESQEVVRRMITENKELRREVQDLQDQLVALSLDQGRSLLKPTEKSWASEIDTMTKEEVVELWTKEKHANQQLRQYIDTLITRILERHPALLEVASSVGR
ncbi:EF hand [Opisthorchis viverrini]|uniref:EF hand n=1 Tax=Opisthorchis viverrini TaxID=6198 RepID=A0A1S8X845_OPIVI|nr:EF hand [Opisthorchis viverrini]